MNTSIYLIAFSIAIEGIVEIGIEKNERWMITELTELSKDLVNEKTNLTWIGHCSH